MYTLEYKVQEIIFGVHELNKTLHILKRYELLCPKFIPGLQIEKTRKNISYNTSFFSYLIPDFISAPLDGDSFQSVARALMPTFVVP